MITNDSYGDINEVCFDVDFKTSVKTTIVLMLAEIVVLSVFGVLLYPSLA